LKEYVDVNAEVSEFCEKMIMSGSNIETVDQYGEGIEKVVVGKILSIERHPDADRLVVCQMDVGQEEPLQIVTGAPNVFEGAKIPVILHGGKLPDGTVIKKGKLRGVASNGMLCSFSELGYDDKVIPVAYKDGVWILEDSAVPGTDIVEAMGLAEASVDFEITPNRPDCLSMLGMARETAATLGGSLRYPDTACVSESGDAADYIKVEIKKPELCRRYAARVVTDVKIEQSPWWLQKRLMHAGMRPINNIVDITNYVMLEYGQPLHAFDIRNIQGGQIVVDTAADGEIFTTLDGVERKLTSDMLLIKDGTRGVALAGVMGGLNSEIEADTTTILVEAANFNGDSVRATSKKLGLRTEASSRFEKGIDPNLARAAADRACRLIELLGAGKVVGGCVDVYPSEYTAATIPVRVERVNNVLGIDLTGEEMEAIFKSLEMETELADGIIKVTPPTVRQDLEAEIDFVEEVARIYGYDRMPTTLPQDSSRSFVSPRWELRDTARDLLVSLGLNEIQTYSFVSPRGPENVAAQADSDAYKFVKILNPLGEENSVMRTTLLPNMLEVLGRNSSRNVAHVRAFEIGNTFFDIPGADGLPTEKDALCIGVYGPGESFFTLKGIVEELLENLGVQDLVWAAESGLATYHSGRCARIMKGEQMLGVMGEVQADVADKFGLSAKTWCCQLDFQLIEDLADRDIHYAPLPKYPASTRDIALLVKEEVNVGDIMKLIKASAGPLLEDVALFDIYRGKQVAEGMKSTAFSLTYRAPDRTLTEEDVVGAHSKVLDALKAELDAVLREM
ncbi:MAG: phenylalanine--tRNA ligase subunit beta, partial [Firmicutes bacterium]|nr:phenylalanine--tRNA ligase subunit beta [Bacillota bacterium]